ncbi:hypothetical protein [Ottowia sp.]|uniref:hypothetical protein n=1 Tax=Ottowia sp. TaxID=1898956 RepID=UPI003A8C5ED1
MTSRAMPSKRHASACFGWLDTIFWHSDSACAVCPCENSCLACEKSDGLPKASEETRADDFLGDPFLLVMCNLKVVVGFGNLEQQVPTERGC